MTFLGLNSVRAFERSDSPTRRITDRQRAGADCRARRLDLRFPARITQIIRDRLAGLPEPIRIIVWKAQVRLSAPLSQAHRGRQGGAEGRRRDRARAGWLHLGDRPHGRAQIRLIKANLSTTAKKEEGLGKHNKASAPNADGRLGR